MKADELRCESCSPVERFDEGPRRCRLKTGHPGQHEALTSDGRYIPHNVRDYTVRWADPAPAKTQEGEYARNQQEAVEHIRTLPPSERSAVANRPGQAPPSTPKEG